FHEVARQVDWDGLAVAFVRRLLAGEGYFVPDDPSQDSGQAVEGEGLTYRALAAANETNEAELRRAVRVQLERHIFRDYAMAQEFRIAMMRLCQAQLEREAVDRAERQAIGDWLRGELRLISALKRSLIFQKVARHNARDLLLSLAHWLRLAGKSGLVLTLDIQRYLETTRHLDGTLYHTPTTVLDMYEVLRQFIDSTDELEGCLIVAIAPRAFLDDPKRGLERYPPLQTRISDEIQDRLRANPLASLVRIEARSPIGSTR
ncbi:MAG: BREX system ATP-binding domain-containing protein, partial [Vicinamibacterales bacterium]